MYTNIEKKTNPPEKRDRLFLVEYEDKSNQYMPIYI
jgi:hypothetical protein